VFGRRQASQMGCIELPAKTVKGRSEMQYSFKLGMPSIVEKCRHRGVVYKRGVLKDRIVRPQTYNNMRFCSLLRVDGFFFFF